jgi:hypothetical protein
MPLLRASITADGPVVELTLWVGPEQTAALRAAGHAVAPPQTIRALIDTGAERTPIDHHVARALELNPDEVVPVRSSAAGGEPFDAPVHDVWMSFGAYAGRALPSWVSIRPVEVGIIAQGVLALIGRDLLETCLFVYDGPRGELVLSY